MENESSESKSESGGHSGGNRVRRLCVACQVGYVNRPGGLCAKCYSGVEEAAERALAEEEGDELEAMRWVMSHPEDRTYQQRGMRRWLEENPGEFRKAWAVLKRAELGRGSSATTSPVGPKPSDAPSSGQSSTQPDPGTERLKGLLPDWPLMKWLFDHHQEVLAWAVSRGFQAPEG